MFCPQCGSHKQELEVLRQPIPEETYGDKSELQLIMSPQLKYVEYERRVIAWQILVRH